MVFLNLLTNVKEKLFHRLMILWRRNLIDAINFVVLIIIQSNLEITRAIVQHYRIISWISLVWIFMYIIRIIEYLRKMLVGLKLIYIITSMALILPPLFFIWLLLAVSIIHNPDLGITTITMGFYYFVVINIFKILLDASQTKKMRASSIVVFWVMLSLFEMGILGIYSATIDNIIREIPKGFIESLLVFVGYGFNTFTEFGLKVPEKVFLSLICMLGIIINKNFIETLNTQ